MSVDAPKSRNIQPKTGEYDASLLDHFEKLSAELGFLHPPESEALLAERSTPDEAMFNAVVQHYIELCIRHYQPRQEHNWDVREFRGILVGVAQLYYERYSHPDIPHDATYLARMHKSKQYLRTVDEDMRWRDEPANAHLDHLLLELGVDHPRLPKPSLVRFNTNIMHILSKIDPNIAALSVSQHKTAP